MAIEPLVLESLGPWARSSNELTGAGVRGVLNYTENSFVWISAHMSPSHRNDLTPSNQSQPQNTSHAAIGVKFVAMAGPGEIRLESNQYTPLELQRIAQLCVDEVKRIEKKYSRYDPQSVVSSINAASGQEPVTLDAETQTLLDYAQTLYDNSSGLFDITSGVLRRAWRFDQKIPPHPVDLQALLPLVSWGKVQRQGGSVFLPFKGMEIDFGGFGKEYAADRASLTLQREGISNGFVNLSGDIRVVGPKFNGEPYRMGIQHPRQPNKLLASIPIHQGALATSGDYERFFEFDGRRYCHIINPQTRQPVQGWQSVSVLAPLAIVAGSCSTCTMLLEDRGLDYLSASGFSFLGVDAQGRVHQQ